ncbi:inositol monophosphatase [Alicyclobacillus fastidiosus]|uniref:Inositol-1-monophosphatase n=1 Tax=Alicyclobacillus fastidiosus TaxID=392011 RepID=A0ABY6ZE85_9BACL|nr:inositol monophosphatase family protein [Alicyclobacillus fastidiosus]WAH40822.1 inositol monophosphatase [Alicyclobacillus fastidiosus]GMA62304.1 inositol monophosphatase [Alicyclobacillus fastidiosus]
MTNDRFDLDAVLTTALEAALEAGDYFKSRFATELVVKTKSSIADLVTDVDPYCEQLIRTRIHRSFEAHQVLGEESVEPGREASERATRAVAQEPALWIVDPLDGTTNYVNAIPLSVVSIAFASRGELQVGVIYDPYREEVFYAQKGSGARLASRADVVEWLGRATADRQTDRPGMKLSVSSVTEMRRAVVSTGMPMRHVDRDVMTQRVMRLVLEAKSLRTLGAAALHLAYVAAGRIDMFWEYELNAWDVAAGVLLIREAGGVVKDLHGGEYALLTRDIVASGRQETADHIVATLRGE